MGKRNGKQNGKENNSCGYTDITIRCHRDYMPRVRGVIDRYPGISYGNPNKLTGTQDFYIPIRIINGVGSENLPLLKRDLRKEIEITI